MVIHMYKPVIRRTCRIVTWFIIIAFTMSISSIVILSAVHYHTSASIRTNVVVDPKEVANPHPFEYTLNNPTVCRDRAVYLIVFVHTAVDHNRHCAIIRETWGDPRNYAVDVRVVFVVGRAPDNTGGRAVERALRTEFDLHGDIVQDDFLDTYRNNAYKAIAGLRWVDKFCPHARWVLKIDDDVFANLFNLLRHLQCLERQEAERKFSIGDTTTMAPR